MESFTADHLIRKFNWDKCFRYKDEAFVLDLDQDRILFFRKGENTWFPNAEPSPITMDLSAWEANWEYNIRKYERDLHSRMVQPIPGSELDLASMVRPASQEYANMEYLHQSVGYRHQA